MNSEIRQEEKREIQIAREYTVVKANEIIQKSRFNLTLLEQKIFCYLVSKIKPDAKLNEFYNFSINEYCAICNITTNNGKNIVNIETALQRLRNKSFYMDVNGKKILIAWLSKVIIDENSGDIQIKFDEDMEKYLISLKQRYTQYNLLWILDFKSQYSIRMYELLKSYVNLKSSIQLDLDNLKSQLMTTYKRYPDFRRNVLEPVTKEINHKTDLLISWKPIKKGRKVVKIEFSIKQKTGLSYYEIIRKKNKSFHD